MFIVIIFEIYILIGKTGGERGGRAQGRGRKARGEAESRLGEGDGKVGGEEWKGERGDGKRELFLTVSLTSDAGRIEGWREAEEGGGDYF